MQESLEPFGAASAGAVSACLIGIRSPTARIQPFISFVVKDGSESRRVVDPKGVFIAITRREAVDLVAVVKGATGIDFFIPGLTPYGSPWAISGRRELQQERALNS